MPKADVPTLADKVERLAGEGGSRNAIQVLLKRYMPTRAVSTRKPIEKRLEDAFNTPDVLDTPSPRQPDRFKPKRAASRRKANQRYEVTGLPDTSRLGTFRHYMLSTIILKHNSTSAARLAHAASGRYTDQTINFNWAEREGYIRFI